MVQKRLGGGKSERGRLGRSRAAAEPGASPPEQYRSYEIREDDTGKAAKVN